MTKILLFICIVLSLPSQAQLTNGLIAHWPFNGNANDVTGNGYNGSANNITYTTGAGGGANTAALFNGSNSYVDVAYKSGMNVSTFSICTRVKVNGYYGGLCQANTILWRGSQFQNGYYSLIFFDTGSCLVADTGRNFFAGQVGGLTNSSIGSAWAYNPPIVSQRWYCVVTTFNGTQSKIYVDGVLKSTYNVSSGSIGSSAQGLAIGANRFASSSQYPYWLNGAIDDLRLYNRALSDAEVTLYCNSLQQDTTVYIYNIVEDTLCVEDSIKVQYDISGGFNTGNVFTLQLSDANGSFSNPTVLSTISSTIGGTFNAILPSNILPGTGYLVRVISSTPSKTSASHPIVVQQPLTPTVSLSVSPTGTLWSGQQATFTAIATNTGNTPVYVWTINSQLVPGVNLPSYITDSLNDNDTVCVWAYTDYKCASEPVVKDCIVININSSVMAMSLNNLRMYPNPNNGSFTLKGKINNTEKVQLQILNAVGQVVYTNEANTTNGKLQQDINLGSIANGIYLLRIQAGAEQQNISFRIAQ